MARAFPWYTTKRKRSRVQIPSSANLAEGGIWTWEYFFHIKVTTKFIYKFHALCNPSQGRMDNWGIAKNQTVKKTNCLENKLFRKHGIFYTVFRKHGIFYTVCLTPAAKTRALIGFIAKKYCEEKNLSSEKIRHTSMVNTWKIKKIIFCSQPGKKHQFST